MECFSAVLFIALIAVLVQLSRSTDRIKKLEQEFETQQVRVLDLNKRLIVLSREVELLRSPAAAEPPPPVETLEPEPERQPEPEIPVAIPPPPVPIPAVPLPLPAPEPVSRPAIQIPVSKPPRPPFDWESLVGVRLFSWMAGIMLVIAAILFLRYSIQHGWLGAPVRMAIGVLTGAGLLAVCEWRVARRYSVTANALDAAGIAILFATFFASHVLWGLLNATTAFLLMALVAGVAVALALRRNAPFIAVLGLLGGFATPALLSSGQDRPITLFGYLLLLNGGLAWVAVRRRWTLLVPLSLAFTFLYQWGWVLRRLDPERLPLAMGVFLVFPVLHMLVLALSRRPDPGETGEKPFWDLTGWSLGLPLLLAAYLAGSPGFGAHYGLLFGYLLLLGAALAAYAAARGPVLLHNLAAAATVIVYGVWLVVSYRSEAWPEILAFLSLSVLLYLGAPWVAKLWRKDLPVLPASLAAPALLGAFPLLLFREPAASALPWPLLGTLALLVLAAGGAALALRQGALHVASLLMAELFLLVWLHVASSHPWPSVALVAAALFAGFGVAWIPLARRRDIRGGELVLAGAQGAVAALFFAQVIAAVACEVGGSPSALLSLLVQVALASALLWLSSRTSWPWVAPASVLSTFLAAWSFHHGSGWERLTLAAVLWLVYLAYPVALGRRARQLREPWLAAVLASAAFFLIARPIVESLGFESVIGVLPVVQAAALAFLLWRLLGIERAEEERDLGRLALLAGAVLAFVTVAIPLQLEKQWITIGWALLAAALAWLYGRIPHRGLLWWTAGLAAAVFTRLSLNPDVLSYHPRADVPVLNWFLYTYLVSSVALLVAARLLRSTDDHLAGTLPRLSSLASAAAGVLLFLLVNIEIADFFSTGETLTFSFLSGQTTLAEGLTYTLGWGIFALALLVTGIALRSRAARVAAIGLLLATVIKGFFFDLSSLGGLYRVASFVGMAVCLAAVAVLIQKFVLARPEGEQG